MKKHWKKILAAFVALFLIVGGYLIYIFQIKEYDIADSEVTEITKETYKIDLPDGTSIELDEDGNIVESEVNNNIPVVSTDNGSSGTNSSNGTTNDDSSTGTKTSTTGNSSNGGSSTGNTPDSGVTVASIKQKYEPVMSSLQSQANSRIDALVGRAYSEYQGKKANGESINYAYFYNKYTSAASELEGRTDKVFYSAISVIEKELVANGYGKSHAQSLINDYEAEKEARRSALLDKAMNR
ncbi:hypothetical protein HMPREF1210_01590 [Paenisporosarcina sp. HGH0030]|uniref:hypothetical protein n=1 Tax=Paenisporosarcina sp. HGH0030 TaxID=1078085 RepID=UPI00034E2C3B|nr:hypothetical protein [Paenisporosarcina sp. HGH0030]EPD52237.1 hypothetical protein HMPREF1210_01590 [Paenisporosarcina sp. HGH0030]